MPELQLGRIKLDLAVQLGVVRNHLPAENPSTHVALVWREYGLHMSSWVPVLMQISNTEPYGLPRSGTLSVSKNV